jgi:hypothetical protein
MISRCFQSNVLASHINGHLCTRWKRWRAVLLLTISDFAVNEAHGTDLHSVGKLVGALKIPLFAVQ